MRALCGLLPVHGRADRVGLDILVSRTMARRDAWLTVSGQTCPGRTALSPSEGVLRTPPRQGLASLGLRQTLARAGEDYRPSSDWARGGSLSKGLGGAYANEFCHHGRFKIVDHVVSPRMVNGLCMLRVAQRVASAISVRPVRRRAPMARLRSAAMILGPDLVCTFESSSR